MAIRTSPTMRPVADYVCPTCGGLECLCRPRFFAGQLLTEEDLNRLDHYIVEKNKLHNRYLHGWGVVCGLEVLCHPCEGYVTVTSGYALSPCGDDIVVCADDPLDVCALIQQCREHERQRLDCEPPRPVGTAECQDIEEPWVLAICFAERPSRGVTPLRGSSAAPCCSRCSCGGSAACGCRCHEAAVSPAPGRTMQSSPRALSRDAFRSFQRTGRNECEPTVTCESYSFRVYKAPLQDPRSPQDLGAMVQRFEDCIKGLFEVVPPLPDDHDRERLQEWCCQLKENWLDYFATHPIHDCQALVHLSKMTCPPHGDQTAEQYRLAILLQLAPVVGEYLRSCLCSALLPPCPELAYDNCVPLATITVRKRDCKIIRVCNLSHRKFVTTFPNLQYWLSFLPFVRQLRQLLERACCRPLRQLQRGDFTPGRGRLNRFVAFRRAAMEVRPEQEFSRLVLSAVANRGRTIDAQTLFLGAMEAMQAGETEQPVMSDVELRNPLQYLLLNQVLRPLVEGAIPEEVVSQMGTRLGSVLRILTAPERPAADIAELLRQVAELTNTVRQQQERIDRQQERIDDLQRQFPPHD